MKVKTQSIGVALAEQELQPGNSFLAACEIFASTSLREEALGKVAAVVASESEDINGPGISILQKRLEDPQYKNVGESLIAVLAEIVKRRPSLRGSIPLAWGLNEVAEGRGVGKSGPAQVAAKKLFDSFGEAGIAALATARRSRERVIRKDRKPSAEP